MEYKSTDSSDDSALREKKLFRITLRGSLINVILLILKFAAGIWGHSAAILADAVHSLTDFATDIIVIVFVKLSNKPKDKSHDYGHGKYETLATAIIGISLLGVGLMVCYSGISQIIQSLRGENLGQPRWIALAAALMSIALKEWAYRFTAAAGKKYKSEAVTANAWHHRSDALSSIGTALGIGGAILLGPNWAVLDPIAAVVVSFFISKSSYKLIKDALSELLEASLGDETENEIIQIAESEDEVIDAHNLQTRRIGNTIAIEMHIRMPGHITLYEAHQHATHIEHRLQAKFGKQTHIGLHLEPIKINGKYEKPVVNTNHQKLGLHY